MIYPPPLETGATIGVTAPSNGTARALHPRLDLVLRHMRDLGFRVVEGDCLRQSTNHVSAPRAARATELMEFLLRDDIDAVFPPWGGEFLIELLPLLDFDALRAAAPTWVLGFSDVSTLAFALTLRTGIASAHCANLMELVPRQTARLTRETLGLLSSPVGATFEQQSSDRWQSKFVDFKIDPAATFQLTEPTLWRALDGRSSVAFSGRLIGGCLDTISRLAGTPYGDVGAFADEHRADGVILYFENCELRPSELVRALWGLRLAGWFDGLSGVLIGRSTASDPDAFGQHAALHMALDELDVPVLFDIDCGHRPPQMLFVNGARAAVQFANGAATVRQTLA